MTMSVTIAEARKIIKKDAKEYSDTQLEAIINLLVVLADMSIDSFVAKRKQKEIIPEQVIGSDEQVKL